MKLNHHLLRAVIIVLCMLASLPLAGCSTSVEPKPTTEEIDVSTTDTEEPVEEEAVIIGSYSHDFSPYIAFLGGTYNNAIICLESDNLGIYVRTRRISLWNPESNEYTVLLSFENDDVYIKDAQIIDDVLYYVINYLPDLSEPETRPLPYEIHCYKDGNDILLDSAASPLGREYIPRLYVWNDRLCYMHVDGTASHADYSWINWNRTTGEREELLTFSFDLQQGDFITMTKMIPTMELNGNKMTCIYHNDDRSSIVYEYDHETEEITEYTIAIFAIRAIPTENFLFMQYWMINDNSRSFQSRCRAYHKDGGRLEGLSVVTMESAVGFENDLFVYAANPNGRFPIRRFQDLHDHIKSDAMLYSKIEDEENVLGVILYHNGSGLNIFGWDFDNRHILEARITKIITKEK